MPTKALVTNFFSYKPNLYHLRLDFSFFDLPFFLLPNSFFMAATFLAASSLESFPVLTAAFIF